MDNNKEYILCAAIKRKEPRQVINPYHFTNDILEIELGYRHHDIIRRYGNELDIHQQGFFTSKNRYVDRVEAMKIAFEAGQVDESIVFQDYYTRKIYNKLFSEDLY